MLTIYDAIILWQTGTKTNPTPRQVASLAKVSLQRVLEVLTKNACMVQMEKGRIKKVSKEYTSLACTEAANSGKFWWTDKINYGCAESYCWKNNTSADALQTPYWNGGIGDNYKTMELLVCPENEAKLRALGMKHWSEVDLSSFPSYRKWEE